MNTHGYRLGPAGRWLVASAVTFLTTGLVASSPMLLSIGILHLLAILWGLGASLLLLRSMLDGNPTIKVASGDERMVRLVVGRSVTLPINVSGLHAHLLATHSVTAGMVAPAMGQVVRCPDGGLALVVSGKRVGHGWLQGFHVEMAVAGKIAIVQAWLPCRLRFQVLPQRFPMRRDAPLDATRTLAPDRSGMGPTKTPGFGLDLRELRDHRAGDAFKHIAWAATARRGRLITREFESEMTLSAWLMVDTSPSMFWGGPGKARIDMAIETAYNLAGLLLARGDRAGLLVHDHQVRLSIPPAKGRTQHYRILAGLSEIEHLYHEDRTELTDRELVEHVASWFRAQKGLTFPLARGLAGFMGPRQSNHDEHRLGEAVDASLEALRHSLPGKRFLVPSESYAQLPRIAKLRAFCRHFGVPLPLDPTPRFGALAQGLEAAMGEVLRHGGGHHVIVVISDLHSVEDLEALRRVAVGTKRHHHSMMFICPTGMAVVLGESVPETPLTEALLEAETLRTKQSLARIEAVLRPAGATFVSCEPGDITPSILARLDRVA